MLAAVLLIVWRARRGAGCACLRAGVHLQQRGQVCRSHPKRQDARCGAATPLPRACARRCRAPRRCARTRAEAPVVPHAHTLARRLRVVRGPHRQQVHGRLEGRQAARPGCVVQGGELCVRPCAPPPSPPARVPRSSRAVLPWRVRRAPGSAKWTAPVVALGRC